MPAPVIQPAPFVLRIRRVSPFRSCNAEKLQCRKAHHTTGGVRRVIQQEGVGLEATVAVVPMAGCRVLLAVVAG